MITGDSNWTELFETFLQCILNITVETNDQKDNIRVVTLIYVEATVGYFTDIIHHSLGMTPGSFGLEHEKLFRVVFHYYKWFTNINMFG